MRTFTLLLVAFLAMATQARAQNWADFATVSMTNATTPKLTANRLCYTDGTDMVCDGAAGLLLTSGTLQITNISTTDVSATGNVSAAKFIGDGSSLTGISTQGDRITSGTASAIANTAGGYISLTTGATTWGYLGSSATYLPIISGTTHYGQYASFTTLTVGGVAITGGGASSMASLTDVSVTGVASGMLLRYNGTKWESVGVSTALSTTTTYPNFPDSIGCSNGSYMFWLSVNQRDLSTGRVTYRFVWNGNTNVYAIVYNSDGSYYSNTNLTDHDCVTSTYSISQLYAMGRAFNFIGSNLQSAVGTNAIQYSNNGVMAAATGLTYNSATNVVSLTGTISATNSYGQYASFTTLYVGGVAVTGGSSGDRITSGTASAIANSTGGYISLTTGATTWGYLGSSATYLPIISGTTHYGQYASFTTLTVGGVAITGAGASSMASLTDVSTTGATSGMLLRYNGTKWESVGASTALSTTTMITNIPDSIICYDGSIYRPLYLYASSSSSNYYRNIQNTGGDMYIVYTSGGAYSGNGGATGFDCVSSAWSLSQLYAMGRAYNFIGSSLLSAATATNGVQWNNNGVLGTDLNFTYNSSTAVVSVTGTVSATRIYGSTASLTTLYVGGVAVTGGSSGDRITSGTASAIANNAALGGYISLTTGNTTWGYLGSSATYIPLLNGTTASYTTLNTTNIFAGGNVSASGVIKAGTSSLTCASAISGSMRYSTTSSTMEYCNGSAWTSMGPSSTQPISFLVNKNGSNQTVTASTWTKLTWGTEAFDTNNNFASDRFTATVAGKYYFHATVYCQGATTCYAALFKNGAIAYETGTTSAGQEVLPISGLFDLAINDYVEVYAYSGSTTIGGTVYESNFSGFIIGPQGSGSGGSTSPAGSDTQLQYNNSGSFGASSNLAWDNTNRTLAVSGSVQFGGTGSEACGSAADYGKNRRNPTSGRMQVCLFR